MTVSNVSVDFAPALMLRLRQARAAADARHRYLTTVAGHVAQVCRATSAEDIARCAVVPRDAEAIRAIGAVACGIDCGPLTDLAKEAYAAVGAVDRLLRRMAYGPITWQAVSSTLTKAGLTRSAGSRFTSTTGFTTKTQSFDDAIRVGYHVEKRSLTDEQVNGARAEGLEAVRAALDAAGYEVGTLTSGFSVRIPPADPPTAEDFLAIEPLLAEVSTWSKT